MKEEVNYFKRRGLQIVNKKRRIDLNALPMLYQSIFVFLLRNVNLF